MTVQDRLRATTEALSDAICEVRPLTLPPERPGLARGPRAPRRAPGWLLPLTAAAAVVAVAASLVTLRSAHTMGPPTPAPVAKTGVVDAAVPVYYVQLTSFQGGARAGELAAVVGDDRTGQLVSTVRPPAGLVFDGVSGAADDRTFVIDAVSATTNFYATPPPSGRHTWLLLRIAPGTAHPATLTSLPITGVLDSDQILGLALSPDASALAVLYETHASLDSGGPFRLQTFSLRTGRPLRTWTAPGSGRATITEPPTDGGGLSWTANGRTLAFMWYGPTWHSYLRTLDVAGNSGSLLADSRTIFANQGNQNECGAVLLAPSGRTLFCGTVGNALAGCRAQEPQFKIYSAATGRLDRVLYTYRGSCQAAEATPLWPVADDIAVGTIYVNSYASHGPGKSSFTLGVFSRGRFTPLRRPAALAAPSGQGPIAF